jgi:hypothetical protein
LLCELYEKKVKTASYAIFENNYSASRPNGSQPFSLSAGSAAELLSVGFGNAYDFGAIAVAEYSFFSR